VENGLAFDSWRPVWTQYGGVVVDVARAAFPDKSEVELRAHMIEASASALIDETTFDPLESLITRVIAQASRESRARAAAVMQQHRISNARIEAMVGVNGFSAIEEVQHPFSEPDDELFEEVRRRAQELFALVPQPDPPAPKTVTGASRRADPGDPPRADRVGVSIRKKFVRVLLAVALVAASGALSARLLWRRQHAGPALLYADRYSTEWRVSEASSFTPAKIRTPPTLVQTFTSLDRSESISLIIADYRDWSAEPDFRSVQTPERGAPKRAEAIVSAIPKRSGVDSGLVVAFWQEGTFGVTLRSDSIDAARAKSFVQGLVETDDLIGRGYEPTDGFVESRSVIAPSISNEVSASVTFTSEAQGPSMPLTVTVNVLRDASKQYRQLQDVNGDIEGSGKPFGTGRTFRSYRTLASGLYGLFEENKYTYFVAAYREGENDLLHRGREGQRSYFQGFGDGELSEADQKDVFFLLGHVRAGSADEWRSLTAGLQASMLQVPIQRSMRFGPLEVTLRREKDFVPGRAFMCTQNTCASLYFIESLTQAADLLVDGHWWHFEELGMDEKIPPWTTSPKLENAFTAEDNTKDRTRWYAIDLGPETRLARSRKDGEILGRPIAN
jgi:hypothetical protein